MPLFLQFEVYHIKTHLTSILALTATASVNVDKSYSLTSRYKEARVSVIITCS